MWGSLGNIFSGSGMLNTLGGAAIGYGVDKLSGGDGGWGAGLGALGGIGNFASGGGFGKGGFDWGSSTIGDLTGGAGSFFGSQPAKGGQYSTLDPSGKVIGEGVTNSLGQIGGLSGLGSNANSYMDTAIKGGSLLNDYITGRDESKRADQTLESTLASNAYMLQSSKDADERRKKTNDAAISSAANVDMFA